MPRRSAVLLALLLAIASCARRHRPEAWTVADATPCTGLTLGWPAPIDELRELVGPGLEPAAGPAPGTGLVLVFVARCPGTTIDGEPTGPSVTAHTIVPIEAPRESRGEPGRGAQGWITIPDTYAPEGSPVGALFRRHGFTVRSGTATLDLSSRGGAVVAHATLTTRGGEIDATATFADSGRTLERVTGIVGPGAMSRGLVFGPERSRRLTGAVDHLTVRGTAPLDGIHLGAAQPAAALDTAFTWSFTFDPAVARTTRP